jgi:hydroxymethylpyrimidine pyrophosphatase-like HAD family hydrolase
MRRNYTATVKLKPIKGQNNAGEEEEQPVVLSVDALRENAHSYIEKRKLRPLMKTLMVDMLREEPSDPLAFIQSWAATKRIFESRKRPMPRLVSCDLDYTLLSDHNNKLSERSIDALRAFAAQPGAYVMIATGQPVSSAIRWAKKLGDTCRYVTCNDGATTCKKIDGKWEVARDLCSFLSSAQIIAATESLQKHLPDAVVCIDIETTTSPAWLYCSEESEEFLRLVVNWWKGENGPRVWEIFKKSGKRIFENSGALQYLQENSVEASRLVVALPQKSASETIEICEPLLKGMGVALNNGAWHAKGGIFGADTMSVHITSGTADKSTAVQKVCTETQLSSRDVMCFGDESNDHALFKWAGWAVAVGNATDETKQLADEVLELTCDQDAVASVLEDLCAP